MSGDGGDDGGSGEKKEKVGGGGRGEGVKGSGGGGEEKEREGRGIWWRRPFLKPYRSFYAGGSRLYCKYHTTLWIR